MLLLSPDDEVDVIDVSGTALIENTWSIDPFANVAFGAGTAADTTMAGEPRARLTELASGVQSELALARPDGTPYRPVMIWPHSGSVWALGVDRNPVAITRWEDGTLTDEVVIGLEGVTGNALGELIAMAGRDAEGTPQAKLVNLEPAATGVMFTVPAPDFSNVHPTPNGGMYVLDNDANVRVYDGAGELLNEIAPFPDKPEGMWVGGLAVDPTTGNLAIATAAGLLLVDVETEETELLTDFRNVARSAFVRDGELLVIAEQDGTVRLWNLERGGSAGLVFDGTGSSRSDAPWFDEETQTVWVASSGLLLQIPVDPDRWIERACEVAGRELTQEEWDRYVPGGGEVQSACGSE